MRNPLISFLILLSFLSFTEVSLADTAAAFASIRANDTATLQAELDNGVDVNARNAAGSTLLMAAAGYGYKDSVDILLERHADIHMVDNAMGVTALHRASQSGNVEIIAELLRRGAHLDGRSAVNGHTALLDAAFYKRYDAFSYLLFVDANPLLANTLGLNAWDWSRRQKDEKLIALLEAQKATDLVREQAQVVTAATKAGDRDQVAALLAAGHKADEITKDGNTPLLIAARNGHAEIVDLLLSAGANPNKRDRVMQATPGHKAGFFGYHIILQSLLAAGLDPDLQGPYNGYTALHDAVLNRHIEAAKVLVTAGARSNIEGIDGKTAASLAKELGIATEIGL